MEGRSRHPGSRGGQQQRGGQRQGGGRARSGGRPDGTRSPLEVAVRSTRNAIGRHAERLQHEESKLACRGLLTGIVGASKGAANPGEVLTLVEQVMHVLEAHERNLEHLPVALRGAVVFVLEQQGRVRNAVEMLRLTMRHAYALAGDHIPRQARDDGGFRASALLDALGDIGVLYMDDATFAAAAER